MKVLPTRWREHCFKVRPSRSPFVHSVDSTAQVSEAECDINNFDTVRRYGSTFHSTLYRDIDPHNDGVTFNLKTPVPPSLLAYKPSSVVSDVVEETPRPS